MVSNVTHEELRRIYEQTYGEELSGEEATAMVARLVALYRLLMRTYRGEEDATLASAPEYRRAYV